ncbi:DNA/RNA-binding protein KIN17 [Sitodiplosis mosellana]|uniref:DNA/RNA-binding protein KIN17 n=1 Tax=Sitodiplosis mosellana TaxID=263140 RepID=UPI0024441583|nr:DNA/RNA-binding protein KIN17 [Sitodiplosis mosellana]XP_055310143.1 DNA/RNA-binding protein KIN17 [Sitodiplosis mosellana]XP_055310144.1 DNA/RNA-binding protein KIN17 [Sitodiplosis mosellana]XP_055310145.1 DNA/RNA-binding protein KIN17 [Sitodiplosis mosellana]XP_055310146.1 DNA/RNA-binding protein KIN17 [Sitodiplosis mosellana]
MGKAEAGTPKYLANKMKAKGLQKLRWYCQMCQKQCRDENGFKCHTQSESHQRQLLLFADNSNKYIYSFSKEFSDGYVELLRRRFGTKRVSANKIYQEYIADKDHLHMNATKWLTLSDYVKHLGREGVCTVDETEKGWFVTYIDRSPEVLERQAKAARKEKQEKDDEDRHMEYIQKQVEKNAQKAKTVEYTEMKRENEDEKIKLSIKTNKVKVELPTQNGLDEKKPAESAKSKDDADIFVKPSTSMAPSKKVESSSSRKRSALDDIIKMEETKKEKINRKDYWLAEGIVVKIITKSLGDKFYKQKGVVLEVIDRYGGKIKLLDSGEKVKLDQAHCETVIPTVGKLVKVLNGGYRGYTAILKEIDIDNYCVSIEIASGLLKGRLVHNVQYEDISKIHYD